MNLHDLWGRWPAVDRPSWDHQDVWSQSHTTDEGVAKEGDKSNLVSHLKVHQTQTISCCNIRAAFMEPAAGCPTAAETAGRPAGVNQPRRETFNDQSSLINTWFLMSNCLFAINTSTTSFSHISDTCWWQQAWSGPPARIYRSESSSGFHSSVRPYVFKKLWNG